MRPSGRQLLGQIFIVLRGTILAQLIGVVVLPILSRLFAPEAFGHLQVYQSLLSVLVIVGALRLELVLLRTAEGETPRAIQTAVLASVGLSGLVALLLGGAMVIGRSFDVLGLPFSPILLVIAMLVAALIQTITYWLVREQRFGQIVGLKLVQAVAYGVVAVAVGLSVPTLDGLIYADISGRIASAALAFLWARKERLTVLDLTSWREQLAFAWTHRRLPLASAPGALLNASGAAITPLMIFSYYGAAESGQVGLLDRVASLPIAMILTAVSQVYVAQFALLLRNRDGGAVRHMNQVTVVVAVLAVVGALVAGPLLPWFFVTVFGETWRTAGQLGQILAPAYAVQLVAGVLNQSLLAMGRYRLQLAWDACWPLLIGGAWLIMLRSAPTLAVAVSVHTAIIVVLGLSFIALAHWSVRRYFDPEPVSGGDDGRPGLGGGPQSGIKI